MATTVIRKGNRLRRKHKHKHKDVYTCDKHKHNATYCAYNSGARFESNMADVQYEEILLLVPLLRRRRRRRLKIEEKPKRASVREIFRRRKEQGTITTLWRNWDCTIASFISGMKIAWIKLAVNSPLANRHFVHENAYMNSMYADHLWLFCSFLSLCLYLCLHLVLMLASSRFTRTTQRRKHKHKQKRMEIVHPAASSSTDILPTTQAGWSVLTPLYAPVMVRKDVRWFQEVKILHFRTEKLLRGWFGGCQ